MLDACVPLSRYWNAPKVLAGLMCVFEEFQEVLCRNKKKGNAWLGSVLTSTVSSSVAIDTQLEAADLVRKLEEKPNSSFPPAWKFVWYKVASQVAQQ